MKCNCIHSEICPYGQKITDLFDAISEKRFGHPDPVPELVAMIEKRCKHFIPNT